MGLAFLLWHGVGLFNLGVGARSLPWLCSVLRVERGSATNFAVTRSEGQTSQGEQSTKHKEQRARVQVAYNINLYHPDCNTCLERER
jgi:hypothetical protein